MKKKILVIGGTGLLGQPVSRYLNESGFGVRVMTRNHLAAHMTFDDSIEIFAGDPMDTACLEEAIHGCYGVHISLPTKIEQQVAEAVAQIARKHDVKHITYISGRTVAEANRWFPMVNRKFLAEKAIRESGIPYTIFCPTWVMEILPKFVNQGRAAVFGKHPVPYHWVAADDCASMVSMAYGLEEAANKRFFVMGPEAIPMREALRRYCAVFHPDIKEVSTMPFWMVKLLALVTRNEELKGAGELMAYFDRVGEGDFPAQDNHILGEPAITLDRWLTTRQAGKAI